jgi:phosphoribosyl-ATP pyrophosphohydrolase
MPDELGELQEHAEHGAEHHGMAPVTMTMAILAVLVAAITLLGHRAHTEEIVKSTEKADQYAYYNANKNFGQSYEIAASELAALDVQHNEKTAALGESWLKKAEHYTEKIEEIQKKAEEAGAEVVLAQKRADKFDLAEVLLECALVISSITLLTKNRLFWYMGIVLGLAGVALGALGLMIH